MVEIGISEFTFGYAFLYEQTQANWSDLKAALVLPNLQQEELQGWDARLPLTGTDFYYQFTRDKSFLQSGRAGFHKPRPVFLSMCEEVRSGSRCHGDEKTRNVLPRIERPLVGPANSPGG
jgi:hypothetical protein